MNDVLKFYQQLLKLIREAKLDWGANTSELLDLVQRGEGLSHLKSDISEISKLLQSNPMINHELSHDLSGKSKSLRQIYIDQLKDVQHNLNIHSQNILDELSASDKNQLYFLIDYSFFNIEKTTYEFSGRDIGFVYFIAVKTGSIDDPGASAQRVDALFEIFFTAFENENTTSKDATWKASKAQYYKLRTQMDPELPLRLKEPLYEYFKGRDKSLEWINNHLPKTN